MRYHTRSLAQPLLKASKQFPVVLLIGARQVGKTTLLQHIDEERQYVTLDDPLIRSLAIEDPPLFLQRFPPPVLIDEIQYAPGLLPYIKMHVDRKKEKGMYWLTGSQQFHLMKGVSESLAGRIAILRLLGLSLNSRETPIPFLPVVDELLQVKSKTYSLKELYYRLWRGFYPAIALNEEIDRDLFYSSYVQTYLQRDVRDLANVGDEMAFLRFLKAAAARTASLLNMSDLARDADISPVTAKKWISILEASGIIYLLQPFHTNITKRLVKAPKLYFLDTGLCSYLTDWTTPETLESGAMSGNIFETCAVIEILKSYYHAGLHAPLYFYRDKDKQEIDLLIIKDKTIYPIEIKKTASPTKDAIKNFHLLKTLKASIGPGGVICLTDQPLPLDEKNGSIPLSLI